MALGDGIRRNIARVTKEERDRFRNAVVQLNNRYYPDGVSKWVKQDQIHEVTHVHEEPSFLPWHRELCNRFEQLIREIDPDLSLHYWDWTEAAATRDTLFQDDFLSASPATSTPTPLEQTHLRQMMRICFSEWPNSLAVCLSASAPRITRHVFQPNEVFAGSWISRTGS